MNYLNISCATNNNNIFSSGLSHERNASRIQIAIYATCLFDAYLRSVLETNMSQFEEIPQERYGQTCVEVSIVSFLGWEGRNTKLKNEQNSLELVSIR